MVPTVAFTSLLTYAVYDLSISGLLGHVRVGATERITHVLASATHPLMIAAIDVLSALCDDIADAAQSGSLYVWEQNTFSLIMVLQTAAKVVLLACGAV